MRRTQPRPGSDPARAGPVTRRAACRFCALTTVGRVGVIIAAGIPITLIEDALGASYDRDRGYPFPDAHSSLPSSSDFRQCSSRLSSELVQGDRCRPAVDHRSTPPAYVAAAPSRRESRTTLRSTERLSCGPGLRRPHPPLEEAAFRDPATMPIPFGRSAPAP